MLSVPRIAAPAEFIAGEIASARFRLAGLMIVSVLPALFWTTVLSGIGEFYGVSFAAQSLAITGGAIALFLATVCAPLMARR